MEADDTITLSAQRCGNRVVFFCAWCEEMHSHLLDREDVTDDLVRVSGDCTRKASPIRYGCFLRIVRSHD